MKTINNTQKKAILAIRLVRALQAAYVQQCKFLGEANKLARKGHSANIIKMIKGKIMGMLNKIRSELKKYESIPAFEHISYGGVIVSKLV